MADIATTEISRLATTASGDLSSFVTGLAKAEGKTSADVAPLLPKAVEFTKSDLEALGRLPEVVQGLKFPDRKRELTEDEEKAQSQALHDINGSLNKLGKIRDGGIRVTLFNHLDRKAEADGVATETTPRDSKGFYLLDGQGPGYAREYSSGTPSASAEKLLDLVIEGKLDRKDYLAMTTGVRVIDEVKFLGAIARKPELLPVVRQAISYSRAASVKLATK